MSKIEPISTESALLAFIDELDGSDWIAIDTEFMRETTYYPILCLIQIANEKVSACIDPLALDSLDPLLDYLYRSDVLKVFHAASQDLEIFCHIRGKPPAPLFDTQTAATLAGHGDQIGYGSLIQKVLGTTLEKAHSRSDWKRRPLSDAELTYALADVTYLAKAYPVLRDDLEARQRLEWLATDFAAIAEPDVYLVEPAEAWKKVKGARRLPSRAQAVVRTLAEWREATAQREDRPRRRVLKDDCIIDIAKRRPKDADSLKRVRDLPGRFMERYGDTVLAAVKAAEKIDIPERDNVVPANVQSVSDLLMSVLRELAEAADVTPNSIANRGDLDSLARGDRDIKLLQGWRRELAGQALLDVVEGRKVIFVDNGKLVVADAG